MKARTVRAAVLAGSVAMLGGCYDFDAPLDPYPTRPVDPALIGSWHCLSGKPAREAEVAVIVVAPSEREHVYTLSLGEDDKEPERYLGYESEVFGKAVLNVRPAKPDETGPWSFMRYSFLLPDVVRFELVDDAPFAGVEETPTQLRAALERLDGQPDVYEDFCVCVRAKTDAPAK